MQLQGRKPPKDGNIQKTIMYKYDKSVEITFCEKETKDIVKVSINLNNNEKGFYAEEYRPESVDANGSKYKTQIPKLEKEIELLELFVKRKVIMNLMGEHKEHDFEVLFSKENADGLFHSKLCL